jgi:hypothetical protein
MINVSAWTTMRPKNLKTHDNCTVVCCVQSMTLKARLFTPGKLPEWTGEFRGLQGFGLGRAITVKIFSHIYQCGLFNLTSPPITGVLPLQLLFVGRWCVCTRLAGNIFWRHVLRGPPKDRTRDMSGTCLQCCDDISQTSPYTLCLKLRHKTCLETYLVMSC